MRAPSWRIRSGCARMSVWRGPSGGFRVTSLVMLRWTCCVAIVMGPCSLVRADPFPAIALPGVDIGGGLAAGYEPSGAVWHSGLDRLFVVDDGGTTSRMKADGTDVVDWVVGGDLEGITVADPTSDFIYLGVEHPDGVQEFDVGLGSVTRTFDLTPERTALAKTRNPDSPTRSERSVRNISKRISGLSLPYLSSASW